MNKPLKLKKCKGCGNQFIPWNSFTKVCSIPCAITFADNATRVKKEKENKKRKKEFYEQDIQWQHTQCEKSFNRLRKLQEYKWFADRGLDPTCISCGKTIGNDLWANGHFRTVGAQGALRYDFKNCYLQHNFRCNKELSGDINGTKTTIGYKKGLAKRFGEEMAGEIISYCENNNATVKWAWQDMKLWRQEWNKEIRELEKCLS